MARALSRRGSFLPGLSRPALIRMPTSTIHIALATKGWQKDRRRKTVSLVLRSLLAVIVGVAVRIAHSAVAAAGAAIFGLACLYVEAWIWRRQRDAERQHTIQAAVLQAFMRGTRARRDLCRNDLQQEYQKLVASGRRGGVVSQVGGHPEAFRRHSRGILVKEGCAHEAEIYETLIASSALAYHAPHFYRKSQMSNDKSGLVQLYLQDLTARCARPCVMDVKMGVRTFLESEISNSKRRTDLAAKMVKRGSALAIEQHADGVTKYEYMRFVDSITSSETLGFRITGMKLSPSGAAGSTPHTPSGTEYLMRHDDLAAAILAFVAPGGGTKLARDFLAKLRALRAALEDSSWFRAHELVRARRTP